MRSTIVKLVVSAGVAVLWPASSHANCGSAFCTVNTDWNVQGIHVEPGARAELRYEYLEQDQPRAGSEKVATGEIPTEHDELSTVNQALFATFDDNFASGWGVSAIVPVILRDHEHFDTDAAQLEQWDFTGLGDIRVAGRYQSAVGAPDAGRRQVLGGLFGLTLPTGQTDETNAEGEAAERSLQPGTGTTGAFGGAYYQVRLPTHELSFFAQAAYALPLDSYHDYQPGDRFGLDLGLSWNATRHLALLVQLNGLWRGHDSGEEAEPEDSGGRFVFISPGVSVPVTPDVQLFALVQLPIDQYVNGVQLTASWGATGGVGFRF
jgi:hypothetical protein